MREQIIMYKKLSYGEKGYHYYFGEIYFTYSLIENEDNTFKITRSSQMAMIEGVKEWNHQTFDEAKEQFENMINRRILQGFDLLGGVR